MLPPAPATLFASDNGAGALPAVLDALVAASQGHAIAYGDDPWTRRATARFAELFGVPVEVFFVYGGTGANVTGLAACLAPWQSVVCTTNAHINVDECAGPERILGAKLLAVPTADGKLRPDDVRAHLVGIGSEHHAQPGVVSLTQSTEVGTLYQPDEVAALAELAHANGMRVHMDGARIANAAAALGGDVRSFTVDAGVDILSFGGTKAGMVYGEAVVCFDRSLATGLPYLRKQVTQLPSKLRFVAAQFEALLAEDRWLRAAGHANAMAALLAQLVRDIPGVRLTREPEVNAVFATVPEKALATLQGWSPFWVWEEATSEVRWMCSFDTTEADVRTFAAGLRVILGAQDWS